MFEKLKSRKFWFAFFGALLPIVAQYLTDAVPMAEALQMSAAVVVSYIFGQGYVDAKVIEASK
jgi:VIT1/CCC1 family predicted Fe2+/Mn2+ transporter